MIISAVFSARCAVRHQREAVFVVEGSGMTEVQGLDSRISLQTHCCNDGRHASRGGGVSGAPAAVTARS